MSTKRMNDTKRMPVVINSTGQTSKSNLVSIVGKSPKDRQNVENIIPTIQQNGTCKHNENQTANMNSFHTTGDSAKKLSNRTIIPTANIIKTQAVAHPPIIAPTINISNRRKSHRVNSPNRKRQEQQNIINSLKAWNVKIGPSAAMQSSTGQLKTETVVINQKQTDPNDAKAKIIASLTAVEANITSSGANSSSNSTNHSNSSSINSVSCSSANGPSSISSNTSSNNNINNNNISIINSSNSVVKNKKQSSVAQPGTVNVPKEPEPCSVTVQGGKKKSNTENSNVSKTNPSAGAKSTYASQGITSDADNKSAVVTTHSTKADKKLLNTNGNFSANHRHSVVTTTSSCLSSSMGGTITSYSNVNASSTSTGSSVSYSSSTTTAPATLPSSSVTVSTAITPSTTNSTKHIGGGNGRASSNAKMLLSNIIPMPGTPLDPIVLLQGKLGNSMKLESFMTTPQNHLISHHHSPHTHHPGQGQPLIGQQHQVPPTTPPHYSLDFLHYVGMRMSNNGASQVGNGSATMGPAVFRGNTHFNYNNFNQQLHQHHIIHQQQQQQQQHHHQQQHHQQQHHHLQRHYANYYNCDDLLIQPSGVSEPVYANFGMSEQLVNNTSGASNDTTGGMAYCYSQNHQHHHHNHQTHQQSFGNTNGHHQTYHQNNNYQQHNRNFRNGGGQHNANQNQQNGGKKHWNNWHNGKKTNMMQGKYGNKGTGFNHSYRKSYHYYNNHHNNSNHHYDQHQDHIRNLVYVRGFDRNNEATESHDSLSRSPTPSPQSESPAIETSEIKSTLSRVIPLQDEKSDSGIEEPVSYKKSSAVQSSSSSSSSMVSIPSTDSSALSSSASQNLSLDLHSGQGYESDSSHSSSFNSHTYRHRKYAHGGQVYRSSSSTSSGVSSTATFPPLNSDYLMQDSASATNTPTAVSSKVTDFFLRSQSYHGSHQNLTSLSGSASPNPPDSPVGQARSLVGAPSMPMFSELFSGHNNHQQRQKRQELQQHGTNTNALYGSNSSLELALSASTSAGTSTVSANSSVSSSNLGSSASSFSSGPPSTVPPNEGNSMQSGQPKRRYSGRVSPVPLASSTKPNRASTELNNGTSQAVSSQQHFSSQQTQQTTSPTSAKNHIAWNHHRPLTVPITSSAQVSHQSVPLTPLSPSQLLHPGDINHYHTPADRFLARSHLVQLLAPPDNYAPEGCKWSPLTRSVWEKFAAAQQTHHRFVQKMQLWKYLFTCIRKAFPRFSLYLVGSTISGFASDDSDVDMCLVCRTNSVPFDMRGEALFQLGQLKNYFMNISTYFEDFSVIQAKVPILRFRDAVNSITVDLNYNNCVGIRNSHLLYCYAQMDWRLRPLTLVVKLWAQHHNINDAKNMTISSYSLVLMVIHFLQYGVSPPILPCLHAMYPDKFVRISDISNLDITEGIDPYKNDNSQTLGELFVQFLEYYANFDYTQYAISVRTASVIPIESARVARSYKNDPHHWRQLCIEEPFDLTNTARSVFDADIFEQIKSVFSTCWQRLKETNDLNSVFDCEPLFVPVVSALSITS